jgi:hypothetical protein
MPLAAVISPDLVRAIFNYDPSTGFLIPKLTAKRVANRVNSKQWRINDSIYSIHRLVWIWHNSTNPRYINFKDGDAANTRIENLAGHTKHPRWENHVKQRRVKIDAYGQLVDAAFDSKFEYQ